MRVVVTGATGTIGQAVVRELLSKDHSVVALSRDATNASDLLGDQVDARAWLDPTGEPPPMEALSGANAVVHLLGEPISQRWSDDARRRIHDSRVLSTRLLVGTLRKLPDESRPEVLVSQSATGFYGPRDEHPVDEHAAPGDGWLAELVVAWEREAAAAADAVRVAITRTGVVLSPRGGALAKMLPFFRLGLGGPVAGGQQYVPWVHLDDVAGALIACAEQQALSGPVNVVAPDAASNAKLSRALGRALHRPAVLPVPGLALRVLYGEMSQLVTAGQRVFPARLIEAGYRFRHPSLDAALDDVLAHGDE